MGHSTAWGTETARSRTGKVFCRLPWRLAVTRQSCMHSASANRGRMRREMSCALQPRHVERQCNGASGRLIRLLVAERPSGGRSEGAPPLACRRRRCRRSSLPAAEPLFSPFPFPLTSASSPQLFCHPLTSLFASLLLGFKHPSGGACSYGNTPTYGNTPLPPAGGGGFTCPETISLFEAALQDVRGAGVAAASSGGSGNRVPAIEVAPSCAFCASTAANSGAQP